MELQIGAGLNWLAPGDIVTLSAADLNGPKAQRLIEEGMLVDISTIVADPEPEPHVEEVASTPQSAEKGGK
jgi:hypothetical protein